MQRDMFEDEQSAKFFQVIQMLQRTALFNMGHFEDQEGKIHFNLGEAKEAIDVIKAIEAKTKGNLSDREIKILSGILSELQMRFVHAPARQRKIEDELAQSEQIRQSFESPSDSPKEEL